MFTDLLDFAVQRQPLQALGWYLAYLCIWLLLGTGIGMLGTALVGAATYAEGYDTGAMIAGASVVCYVAILGWLLIAKRDQGVLNLVLVAAALILGYWAGGVGGLVPLAVLTTRETARP